MLSFSAVARKFRITMDTELDPAINLHLRNGMDIMFKRCSGGLYYYDTNSTEHNTINIQVTDYTFINTVERNKAYFHQREIKGSGEARIPQKLAGWPSTQTIKEALKKSNQKLPNHHGQHQQSRVHLWAKYNHNKRQNHQTKAIEPKENTEDALTSSHYQTPQQCVNSYGFLFVNISPFLNTKSRKIDFMSVQACKSRGKSEIISSLKLVNSKYQDRGFTMTDFHGDNEF